MMDDNVIDQTEPGYIELARRLDGLADDLVCAEQGRKSREAWRCARLDNAQSGRIDECLNSSHDWRSRGIDHGGVLSDRRAERLGPSLR